MWFYLALLSAFFGACSNMARRTHGSLAQPAELSWWTGLFGFPLGIGLLLIGPRPLYTSYGFILPVIVSGIMNTVAGTLQFRAYSKADASVVSPIANLMPVLLIGTSFLLLGILPGWGGFVGILFIVAGVYYSSVSGKHQLLHPLKQLFHNKGSRAMLGTVLIWSFTTILAKVSLRSATPALVMIAQLAVSLICLSVYLLLQPRKKRLRHGEKVIRTWGWHILAISVFATLAVFFQYQAISMVANPSYVLAVKRVDVLITILFAGFFLREKHILKRFEGSLIALVGIVIIYIFK